MASYADTFFINKEKTLMFVYYPKRKAVNISWSKESSIKEAMKFLLKVKDDLLGSDLIDVKNLLPQKMMIKHIVFETNCFAEQKPKLEKLEDFHKNRILAGKDKENVKQINSVSKCVNPFYYPCGMDLFWQVDLKEPFTIIKDAKEKKISFKGNIKSMVSKFIKSYPGVNEKSLEIGFFDLSKTHHGWSELLVNANQRIAFVFSICQGEAEKEKFYFKDRGFFSAKEHIENELSKKKMMQNVFNDLEKEFGDKIDISVSNDFRGNRFLVVIK